MPDSRTRTTSLPLLRAAARPTVALGVTLGLILSSGAAAVAATTADVQTVRLTEITDAATSTLADARATMRAAHAIEAEAEASDLTIDAPRLTVDTTDLRDDIVDLSTLDVLPTFILTDVTESASDEMERVSAQTATLRGALETAKAEKKAADEAAAAEAAAAAAAEAERQRAEAAAAALAAANTVEGAQAAARDMSASTYGWGADQFSCLVSLWSKESGWNYQAYNASSGATGIPQALPGSKMASAGTDWQTNASTQVAWGLDYISAVYGSPCSAWGHSQATNWY